MEDIEKIVGAYRSIQLAKVHLKNLNERLKEENSQLTELYAILNKEYDDIQQLEKLSVKKLFNKFLGAEEDKERLLEIERQEYLLAVLKYNECKKVVELLEFEQGILEKKVAKEKTVTKELDTLVNERATFIAKTYPTIKNDLLKISSDLDHHFGFKRELHEAQVVALKAEELFEKMVLLLKNSQQINTWESNPSPVAQMYSDLDQAQQLSYLAKPLMDSLGDELADIYNYKSVKLVSQFEEFKHFNDIYYDRLITDYIIYKRIKSALTYLDGTLDRVNRIIETLKLQTTKTEHTINYLKQRKKDLILDNVK